MHGALLLQRVCDDLTNDYSERLRSIQVLRLQHELDHLRRLQVIDSLFVLSVHAAAYVQFAT